MGRRQYHRPLARLLEPLEDRRVLALFIDVGNHVLLPDTPGQQINFYVTGDPTPVYGAKFYVQVADGGPESGGTIVGPVITDLDIIADPGLIFHDNNTGETNPEVNPWPQWEVRWTSTIGFTSVIANGLVGIATIDTTGFSRQPGSTWQFDLIVRGPKTNTVFTVSTFPYSLAPTITNGSIVLNNPPTAAAGGPYTVAEGGSIQLDGSGSADPDLTTGDTLTYQWDLDYDGATFDVDATGPSPLFSAAGLDDPHTRTIGLRVTDSYGFSHVATTSLSVTNAPPIVAADDPHVAVGLGQTATNTGSFSDPGGDAVVLTASIGSITQADGTWNWSYDTTGSSGGTQTVTITATDSDGAVSTTTFDLTVASGVVGRHVFYNRSHFDGDDPAANPADDLAVAIDKAPLLPGGTAAFANYTSYVRGINGIMVDVHRPAEAAAVTAGSFEFRVGNSQDPSQWAAAAPPESVTVRSGAGVGGSDRVTIIWPDFAVRNQWLQVLVHADEATGLAVPDVFYFGNAVGESGNSVANAFVDGSDFAGARDNPRLFPTLAPIDFRFDYDRNSFVDGTDLAIARDHSTNFMTALKLIQVPAAAPEGGAPGAPSGQRLASGEGESEGPTAGVAVVGAAPTEAAGPSRAETGLQLAEPLQPRAGTDGQRRLGDSARSGNRPAIWRWDQGPADQGELNLSELDPLESVLDDIVARI